MVRFDFDLGIQEVFNENFSNIKRSNWKSWLDISSPEDYENLVLKLTSLSNVENFYEIIKKEETESKDFSVNFESYIKTYNSKNPLIMCHTSGTTNSKGIKWFPMTRHVIEEIWAPGMQAIFESSGLNSKSSAVIFVPSRMAFDGINNLEEKEYCSLYSSEFSQRIMLSIINPASYLLYEYKKSIDLLTISEILSLDNIKVISAPSATILKWADIEKLTLGINKSLASQDMGKSKALDELLKIIEEKGLIKASKIIQKRLSKKLSNAVLVFSISSLSESQWELLRSFMNWEKDEERFTNLYVASEIGPFAASIGFGDFETSRKNRLFVFPLTFPTIENKGKKELICYTDQASGRLFVSRMHNSGPLININTGDVIRIENQEGLPQINGKIIRFGFSLKYPISISEKIILPRNYKVYVGDYFNCENLKIIEPRNLLNCLSENCKDDIDTMLLVKNGDNFKSLKMILPHSINGPCSDSEKYSKIVGNCPKPKDLINSIKNGKVELKIIDEQPVQFLKDRTELLSKVREGQIPKGLLKKWPLYIIIPSEEK